MVAPQLLPCHPVTRLPLSLTALCHHLRYLYSQVQHGCQSSGQCDETAFCVPESFYCVGRDGELPESWGVYCDESNNPALYNESKLSKNQNIK